MIKRVIRINILLITLFSLNLKLSAYEFVNKNNEGSVNSMIQEIYDTKELYEELVGNYSEEERVVIDSTSSSYWWPIGSVDTVSNSGKIYATSEPETVLITSYYGYRTDPINGTKTFHSGLDISGGQGLGKVNVIAAKDGIVVYPTSEVSIDCPSDGSNLMCNGGYGNHVIIQHSDGNYTLYAHLYEGSITVKAGDQVQQGQVIGKMGSSGYSTGSHLHFEIRVGANDGKITEDPLNYISSENPREVTSTSDNFLEFLKSIEGTGEIRGDSYVVYAIGDGKRTVGIGVTLESNPERFKKYGIDINDYSVGSTIPIKIVDQIMLEIIEDMRGKIETILVNESITLNENQIEALISFRYNRGNIDGFCENYKRYGDTQELYDNWFGVVDKNYKFYKSKKRRREKEWKLFHYGQYTY